MIVSRNALLFIRIACHTQSSALVYEVLCGQQTSEVMGMRALTRLAFDGPHRAQAVGASLYYKSMTTCCSKGNVSDSGPKVVSRDAAAFKVRQLQPDRPSIVGRLDGEKLLFGYGNMEHREWRNMEVSNAWIQAEPSGRVVVSRNMSARVRERVTSDVRMICIAHSDRMLLHLHYINMRPNTEQQRQRGKGPGVRSAQSSSCGMALVCRLIWISSKDSSGEASQLAQVD